MIAVHQRIDRPGGTAVLAGRPVARIGYGAMQLPGPHVLGPPRERGTVLAVLPIRAGREHRSVARARRGQPATARPRGNGASGDHGIDLDSQLAEMVSLRDDGSTSSLGHLAENVARGQVHLDV